LAIQTRCPASGVYDAGHARVGSGLLLAAHACRTEVCSALPDDGGASFLSFNGTSSGVFSMLPDFGCYADSAYNAAGSNQHLSSDCTPGDSFDH
jgi:hypothetical protein